MDPALRQATLAAQNIQSPSSPLGASSAPELAALYQSSFQLPQATAAAGAAGEIASQQVAEAKRAAAEAAARAKQRESDMQDVSKYRAGHMENGKFVPGPKQDGGFDFFDPDGKQVDIATLTKNTGVNAAAYLDKLGSLNPIDKQYVSDYKNLEDFMNAVVSKDKKSVDGFTSAQPALKKYTKGGANDLSKLISDFRNHYQRFYVTRAENPQAWGYNPGGAVFGQPQSGSGTDISSILQQLQQGQ